MIGLHACAEGVGVIYRGYRGTSLIRSRYSPQEQHRTLGIGLLQGPRGRRFLMKDFPRYGGDFNSGDDGPASGPTRISDQGSRLFKLLRNQPAENEGAFFDY